MTSQWNSFTNYRVGDSVQNGSSVIYGCILANTNQPPPNPTYWNDTTPQTSPTTTYASFYSGTTQALNNGAETIISYDGKTVGTGDLTPAGGGFPTTGILVENAGIYKFLFSIQVDRTPVGTGDFQAYVKVGGFAVAETNTQIIVNQNTQTLNTCEFILSLTAGAIIEVGCWSNSVGQQALAVAVSPTTPVAIPSIISNIYCLERN
jgi:hypothetical protein